MAEFDWWLLVLGLVVGGGLVYLVLAEGARREADLEAEEHEAEASWIAERLADGGRTLDPAVVAEVLDEHRAYLSLPPPDAIETPAPAPDRPAGPVDPAAASVTSRASQPPPAARREALTDGETRA